MEIKSDVVFGDVSVKQAFDELKSTHLTDQRDYYLSGLFIFVYLPSLDKFP